MGTTASAAPQPVYVAPPLDRVHANGMANSSMSPFHTVSIHNSKAKSIITNKVAPVGEYFLVQDVYSKADVLNTTGSYGAPNFRQVKGSYPLYGMGQPTLNGFKQVLQRLQAQGQEVLPLQLHDFAKLTENIFYVYNDIEFFKDEPQKMSITCEEDIHVTEEVYKRPMFTMQGYRLFISVFTHRGLLFSGFVSSRCNKVSESPSLCLGHNASPQPPTLLFSCQVGVGRTNLAMILGTLLACMDVSELSAPAELVTKGARILQVADEYLAPDVLSTVKEMKAANFRRVPKMPVYGVAQPTSEAIGAVLAHLTDEKRKHSHVLWINLQEELSFEVNGQIFTPREPSCLDQPIPVPTCDPQLLQDFDKLLEAMKSALAEDNHSAFVFNCSNGRGRTTTAMVVADIFNLNLTWVLQGFPDCTDDEIVSVPDAKYTKGEFESCDNEWLEPAGCFLSTGGHTLQPHNATWQSQQCVHWIFSEAQNGHHGNLSRKGCRNPL
ncbi:hypothetical protein GOODEAATRI_004040 [Goodea atripinnis]|uniref:Uncharacterized protein n=1 Tax=Goodea atripinnis TaxID=208336 RepID=A0ABV0PKP9_9TELE